MNKKVKVRVFFDEYGFDIEKKSVGKVSLAQDELNEFIENNNIRVIDIKFQIGGDSNGDVALMLVYNEIPDTILTEEEYNDEFIINKE